VPKHIGCKPKGLTNQSCTEQEEPIGFHPSDPTFVIRRKEQHLRRNKHPSYRGLHESIGVHPTFVSIMLQGLKESIGSLPKKGNSTFHRSSIRQNPFAGTFIRTSDTGHSLQDVPSIDRIGKKNDRRDD